MAHPTLEDESILESLEGGSERRWRREGKLVQQEMTRAGGLFRRSDLYDLSLGELKGRTYSCLQRGREYRPRGKTLGRRALKMDNGNISLKKKKLGKRNQRVFSSFAKTYVRGKCFRCQMRTVLTSLPYIYGSLGKHCLSLGPSEHSRAKVKWTIRT
jgi:hypothetical protein